MAGTLFLLCPAAARADVYYVTVSNVIFNGPCVGGGTCTETANGAGYYDPTLNQAWNTTVLLTGSLNVTFNVYGAPPQCNASGCFTPPVFYDPNASPGYNPIEIDFGIANFNAPTPTGLPSGGTELFVPFQCGGDQSACNMTGTFLGNGSTDYVFSSGTYTSVDVGPDPTPEPASFVLVATGVLGLLSRRQIGRHAN